MSSFTLLLGLEDKTKNKSKRICTIAQELFCCCLTKCDLQNTLRTLTFGLETLEEKRKRKTKYKELPKVILPTNFADKFTVCWNLFEKNKNEAEPCFR